MTIKAVVFDIGGVLEFNPRTGWLERWEKQLGVPLLDVLEQLEANGKNGSLGTCTEAEWIAGVCEATGMSAEHSEAFMADLWEEYVGTLNHDVAMFFAELRPRWRTAIISNSFVGAREREQALYDFEGMTEAIIYSHEVGVAKPDPRIYQLACERLALEPEEILFLDDVPANVEAARALGMHAVLFESTEQAIADVKAELAASMAAA